MVGYPIQNDSHAKGVRLIGERAQVGERTVFRIDFFVVFDTIRRPHTVEDPLFINGHEPNDVGTETFDVLQFGNDTLQVAFRTLGP